MKSLEVESYAQFMRRPLRQDDPEFWALYGPVLELLKKGISVRKMAIELGLSKEKVVVLLDELVTFGMVEKEYHVAE